MAVASILAPLCWSWFIVSANLSPTDRAYQDNENFPIPRLGTNFTGNLTCGHCGKIYTTYSKLRRHQMQVVRKTRKTFKCPHCDKACSERSNLERHLQTHKGKREFACPTCGKTNFTTIWTLESHMRLHRGDKFQCEVIFLWASGTTFTICILWKLLKFEAIIFIQKMCVESVYQGANPISSCHKIFNPILP